MAGSFSLRLILVFLSDDFFQPTIKCAEAQPQRLRSFNRVTIKKTSLERIISASITSEARKSLAEPIMGLVDSGTCVKPDKFTPMLSPATRMYALSNT